jgi:tetratricopeptide (TPR) repeat protein
MALREWSRAELDCRRALQRGPSLDAQVTLARCLRELGRLDDAARALEGALTDPGVTGPTFQLAARVFLEQGRHRDALSAARAARARDASRDALLTLIDTLAANGESDELRELLEEQILLNPEDARLWTSLGMCHYGMGASKAAEQALERAIAIEPHCVDAHCGLGWALLRAGEFSKGFLHHEYRLKNAGRTRRFAVAPWRGEDLAGKHVLLCAEQGFGDTIQFARFVPRVRALAARTTFLVPPGLARLFGSAPELGEIDGHQPGFGFADYQTLLMSLPHLLDLGTDIGTSSLPFLVPEPARVARWRARLPPGPKIAIAWQGNPKYGGEPWRSMPCEHFAPLVTRFAGQATIVSLQKHVGRDQLRAAPFADRVLDLGDEIDCEGNAFVDSLAILSLVDAFITTDSAIAHVAGSASVRAWVLLSHAADWRWGTEPERTAWYPELRLFRQAVPGDWPAVVDRVVAELARAQAQTAPAFGFSANSMR